MSSRLLSAFGGEFMAEVARVGDLNGDGAYELLFAQSDPCTREITCLTATDLFGAICWQTGEPSRENTYTYSDLAVQIYDWDGDGCNEVLWIEQAIYAESIVWDYALGKHIIVPTSRRGELRGHRGWAQEMAQRYEEDAIMHVLDGATGREKAAFPLPAPADDCFAFANLTGTERPRDLVVKDRYRTLWGIAHDGGVLWRWEGNTGHYPAVGDVDGDGRDEVFLGSTLLGSDGAVRWSHEGLPHQDVSCILRYGGETRLVYSHGEGGEYNGGLRCLDVDGREIWRREHGHGQYVVPGRYQSDVPGIQFAVADLGWVDPGGLRLRPAIALYDWDGVELYRQEFADDTGLVLKRIDWLGDATRQCLALLTGHFEVSTQAWTSDPLRIIDIEGRVINELPMVGPDGQPVACTSVVPVDLWGDTREEALLLGKESCNCYTNAALRPQSDLSNATAYGGR